MPFLPTTFRVLALAVCTLALAFSAPAQVLLDLNFSTTNQFIDNFRSLNSEGSFTQTGGVVSVNSSSTSPSVFQVDLTDNAHPGTPFAIGQGLEVSFQFRSTVDASLGVYFADPASLDTGTAESYLGLFNGNVGTDQVRFGYNSGGLSSGNINTVPAAANFTGVTSSAEPHASATTLYNYSLTLTTNGNIPTLTMKVDGMTDRSYTFNEAPINFTNNEAVIVLRLFESNSGSGGSVTIDNFKITAVPEPSPVLASLGALGALFCLRSRRRRSE
jgi:hypothetical protein